jgi:hypothetical protein
MTWKECPACGENHNPQTCPDYDYGGWAESTEESTDMEYENNPAPTGLHAKLLAEARELSPYVIVPAYGKPNHVAVFTTHHPDESVYRGHRAFLPPMYRFARDPYQCLTNPASD